MQARRKDHARESYYMPGREKECKMISDIFLPERTLFNSLKATVMLPFAIATAISLAAVASSRWASAPLVDQEENTSHNEGKAQTQCFASDMHLWTSPLRLLLDVHSLVVVLKWLTVPPVDYKAIMLCRNALGNYKWSRGSYFTHYVTNSTVWTIDIYMQTCNTDKGSMLQLLCRQNTGH